ncbi:zinc finger protein, putative [Bodo saltans]|uniref:Zinc finger protein, putative n=1 Tax=Bodo saltans TaxID=75058 RepID=A0A0S4JRH3_BODSA|nr:zinc finger protein, putative [Bodo saltans]|eukprot:CUG94118.1 zinc finger protein, putative [Bodo saltans]
MEPSSPVSEARGTTNSGDTPGGRSSVTGADASLCGICFCDVDPVDNPRGALNTCDHLFCLHCISTWAKDTNVCPHCKARFTRITSIPPPNSSSSEPLVIKVRRKNYRGWEEAYDDDDDDEGAVAAAVQASVTCKICHSSANAARMLFCDRRTCHFVAHLDCLEIREAPLTYVCAECSGVTGGVGAERNLLADVATAERLQREIEADERTQRAAVANTRAPPPPPAAQRTVVPVARAATVVPAPQPVVPVAQVRVEQSREAAEVVDDVPYYLRGSAHAEVAQQQLQSRLEASAYQKQLKAQQKGAVRSNRSNTQEFVEESAETIQQGAEQHLRTRQASTTSTPSPSFSTLPQPAVVEESAEQIERRLTKMFFKDQLVVVRRRDFVQRNQLRLVGEGNIAIRPVNRVEELSREDALRVEALQIAQRMAKDRMEGIHRALKLREERALKFKAAREAHALAKLAEIIAQHRLKELQALRNRLKPTSAAGLPNDTAAVAQHPQIPEADEGTKEEIKVKQEPKW